MKPGVVHTLNSVLKMGITRKRIGAIHDFSKSIPRDYPKGLWIIYLTPAIPGIGSRTIIAFSTIYFAPVYFDS